MVADVKSPDHTSVPDGLISSTVYSNESLHEPPLLMPDRLRPIGLLVLTVVPAGAV